MKFVIFFIFLAKLIWNFSLKSQNHFRSLRQEIESRCGQKNEKFFSKILGLFGKKINCEKESNKISFSSEEDKGKNVKCCELINNYLFEVRAKLRGERMKQVEVSRKIIQKNQNILNLFSNLRNEISVLKNQIPKQYNIATYLTKISHIIRNDEDAKTLESWFVGQKIKLKLLFSSDRHLRSSSEFHNIANNKGATITLVESESGI